MSFENQLEDVERVVRNAANSLGFKVNIVKKQFDDVTNQYTIGIAQDDKTLLLRVPRRCYEQIRDNSNHHRITELKAKITKLLTPSS